MSSLLHDVLRPNPAALDSLSDRLAKATLQRPDAGSDDEDELVGVTSLPGTPGVLSRPTSRPTSRSSSPTRTGARSRLAPGPLKLAAKTPSSDPLKAFPTELGQRIFSMLTMRDLARCSRVSRKWNKSQTLNYVWFQHYRMDSFHDETLPPGKWTRRESKQNWRQTLMKTLRQRSDSPPPLSYSSRRASPPGSGYQTPKEVREEKWKSENEAVAAPSKNEMREVYKSLDGRKVKGKGKIGTTPRRDRGGWDNGGEDW